MEFIKIKSNFFLILFIFLTYYNYAIKNRKRKIIIEVDISGSKIGNKGPTRFIQGINELLSYSTNSCNFIASETISPINGRNKSDYFYLPNPYLTEDIYNEWININKAKNLLLGPVFVPSLWNNFPNNKIWAERIFKELLKKVKGIIVHSNRVREYLAQKSNTTNMIKKYKIVRPCTNLTPLKVNSFDNRNIDILFFEKYSDLDRKKQAIELLSLFNKTSKKITRVIYGNYTKGQMQQLANNSKFIVYFSFFDTGAIGLKEIQNYGVFAFSHQKDLVIDNKTSFYIPELNNDNSMNKAFKKIMTIINLVKNHNPNSQLVAKKNQKINKCQNTLDDLCKSLL